MLVDRNINKQRKLDIDKSLNHCCIHMKEAVESPYSLVNYMADKKRYLILDKSGAGADTIIYCFACGTYLYIEPKN